MEHSKSRLYIVAIVGIIAVVAIVMMVLTGNKDKTAISSGTDTSDLAGKSYDLGYCHYDDGSSTGCPCSNPSNGVLSTGAKLVSGNC